MARHYVLLWVRGGEDEFDVEWLRLCRSGCRKEHRMPRFVSPKGEEQGLLRHGHVRDALVAAN